MINDLRLYHNVASIQLECEECLFNKLRSMTVYTFCACTWQFNFNNSFPEESKVTTTVDKPVYLFTHDTSILSESIIINSRHDWHTTYLRIFFRQFFRNDPRRNIDYTSSRDLGIYCSHEAESIQNETLVLCVPSLLQTGATISVITAKSVEENVIYALFDFSLAIASLRVIFLPWPDKKANLRRTERFLEKP